MRIEATVTEAGRDGNRVWMILQAAGRRVFADIDMRDQTTMRRLASATSRWNQPLDLLVGTTLEIDVREVRMKGGSTVLVAVDFAARPYRSTANPMPLTQAAA